MYNSKLYEVKVIYIVCFPFFTIIYTCFLFVPALGYNDYQRIKA